MSSEPKTLYVGNLNFATEDESLERVFMEFGKVLSAEHVVDRFDPMRKRGFGFVTFENGRRLPACAVLSSCASLPFGPD